MDSLDSRLERAFALLEEKEEEALPEILEKIKPPVTIYQNNETGKMLFAVVIKDSEWWLDSFERLFDAYMFVSRHKLPLSATIFKGSEFSRDAFAIPVLCYNCGRMGSLECGTPDNCERWGVHSSAQSKDGD